MKKVLTLLFINLLGLALYAQRPLSYAFEWAEPNTLTPTYKAPTSSNRYGDYISGVKFTAGPVSFTIDDSAAASDSKARFIYAYNTMTVEMRAYDNTWFVIECSDDYYISEIKFEESALRDIPLEYDGTDGTLKSNLWTPSEESEVNKVELYVISTTYNTNTVVSVRQKSSEGVDDIKVDGDTVEQWYTLDGNILPGKPAVRGIYLRRHDGKVSKVII